MDKNFIANKALERFKKIDDEIALVVTIHLCTEYWLNRILEEKLNKRKKGINELNFKKKLDLINKQCIIPGFLYDNIRKLNELRNTFAHELFFNLENADWDYFTPDDLFDGQKMRLEDQESDKLRLLLIGVLTFVWLNNHCINVLGMSPDYKL
ncbi:MULTISPECIES: hypothetical protein [Bacillus]|uniref:hypothetical protein n=1 Tax=Bacillus TaxID=1386 RepID=UPI000BF4034B|nr:hypothetical protein [Bacillus cereus]MCU7389692.1 hypothetical protein [Bacillus sp. ST24]EKS8359873.1 hypothetical protein [Bacillus cereus]MDA2609623.1 hypothetical protein [Bacillus cereus]PFQ34766.1 hypothetical protein COK17_16685 [Bacillus cereus]PGT08722.1 hypothetical protein COD03_23065 [Bacillus cereus]